MDSGNIFFQEELRYSCGTVTVTAVSRISQNFYFVSILQSLITLAEQHKPWQISRISRIYCPQVKKSINGQRGTQLERR